MKKLILATSLAVSLFAGNEYFAGVGIGHGSMTVKATRVSDGATGTADANGGTQSLILGMIKDKKHELQVNYAHYNTVSGLKINSFGMDYSYLFMSDKKLNPFIGLGYQRLNYKDDCFNLNTNIFNVNIGANYNIDQHNFISFTFKQSISTSGSDTCTYDGEDYKLELDEINNFTVAYNYKF